LTLCSPSRLPETFIFPTAWPNFIHKRVHKKDNYGLFKKMD
jgi:hypothetical protein